jgi:uncharacterized protein DUF6318
VGVRVALAAVVVAVVVAGCGGGGDPTPTEVPTGATSPPVTSSPPSNPPSTAATTPTPTPPALPASAREDSPTGAESFARYWMAVLDYATTTGDTESLRALGKCGSCEALAKSIDSLYSAGGRAEGGHLNVVRSSVGRHVPGSAALVRIDYDQAAGREIPASGSPKTTPAQSGLAFAIALGREGSRWTVVKVQNVETS